MKTLYSAAKILLNFNEKNKNLGFIIEKKNPPVSCGSNRGYATFPTS